jgi:hypothetical protein
VVVVEEGQHFHVPAAGEPDVVNVESVEEHHVVAWLCSELKDLDPGDETFDAKVTVLIENVEHHIKERRTTGSRRSAKRWAGIGSQSWVNRWKRPSRRLRLIRSR